MFFFLLLDYLRRYMPHLVTGGLPLALTTFVLRGAFASRLVMKTDSNWE